MSISHSSARMRAEPRWSASSLSTTVPMPCQGEPSRRIANLLAVGGLLLEEARIDGVEAWFIHREPRQRAVRGHHRARRFRPYVVIGGEAILDRAGLLYRHHA